MRAERRILICPSEGHNACQGRVQSYFAPYMYNLLDGSWNQMIIGVYHKEQFIFAVLHASIHGTLLAAVFLMDIGDWHPFFGSSSLLVGSTSLQ